MYAIKWTSNNPITNNTSTGLVCIKNSSGTTNELIVFKTLEDANEQIDIFKKTASSTVSFEAVPIDKNEGTA